MKSLLCKIFGHKYNSSCDWGFGLDTGEFDIWCKRCDKMQSMSIADFKNIDNELYLKARKKINDISGIDVNQKG